MVDESLKEPHKKECKIYVDSLGSRDIPSGRGYKNLSNRGTRLPQTEVQDSHRQKIWVSLVGMTREVIEDEFGNNLFMDLRLCARLV